MEGVAEHGRNEEGPARRAGRRFEDDLVGLDPHDPEARAFAEHLDRMEHATPRYTVEGYLDGVQNFAESANRVTGHRRLVAILVVGLILLDVLYTVWEALLFILGTFLGAGG